MQSRIDPHLEEIASSKTGPKPWVNRGIYDDRRTGHRCGMTR